MVVGESSEYVLLTFSNSVRVHIINGLALAIWTSNNFQCRSLFLDGVPILTLNKHADDQEGPWLSRGAGQCTDEILQTVRDPTSLSAQR